MGFYRSYTLEQQDLFIDEYHRQTKLAYDIQKLLESVARMTQNFEATFDENYWPPQDLELAYRVLEAVLLADSLLDDWINGEAGTSPADLAIEWGIPVDDLY